MTRKRNKRIVGEGMEAGGWLKAIQRGEENQKQQDKQFL